MRARARQRGKVSGRIYRHFWGVGGPVAAMAARVIFKSRRCLGPRNSRRFLRSGPRSRHRSGGPKRTPTARDATDAAPAILMTHLRSFTARSRYLSAQEVIALLAEDQFIDVENH